jgi:hypothetical protein
VTVADHFIPLLLLRLRLLLLLLLLQVRTYKHVTRPLPMGSFDEGDEEEEELCSANGLPSSRSREQMLETWCGCAALPARAAMRDQTPCTGH